jgi:hypothetical protein
MEEQDEDVNIIILRWILGREIASKMGGDGTRCHFSIVLVEFKLRVSQNSRSL